MKISYKPAFYLFFTLIILISSLCLDVLMIYRPEFFIRWLKLFLLSCLILICSSTTYGFVYGEHKQIGDLAFYNRMQYLAGRADSKLLYRYLESLTQKDVAGYGFPALSAVGTVQVTYGMLSALSGDHQNDPVVLEAQLRDPNSIIQKIIQLHQLYLDKGEKAAPDADLTKLDISYALTATVNLSHFYAYGKSFPDQLKDFDPAKVKQASDRAYLSAFVKSLLHTNAMRMYVSLHLLAIDLAEKSGKMALADAADAANLLQQALLINGFADHFLEDAFSGGHLVVNRRMLESFTNNKALHDFYSEHGTMVVNQKGQIWRAYGDGKFEAENTTGKRVILAVELSLQDLMDAFVMASNDKAYGGFLSLIPDQKELQPDYLIKHIAALSLVPIPYNSNLEKLMPASIAVTDSMRKVNQLLYYRNFIKSRIGNSFLIGTQNAVAGPTITGLEFRLNAFNFSKKYAYNAAGGKKGMLDYWHGYTLSYHILKSRTDGPKRLISQITGGVRSNFDYWLSERRFLGLYSYMETGLQFENHHTDLIFAPSLGINLGSLLNINYYNMPAWLRIPAMYLLPLKVRYGPVLSFSHKPEHFVAIELDLFL
ncbi:hypothetical protein [Pedobacter sp. MC2016-24]|uniref:hypothetical protein n=1 Tax=Pedobacter sp. MC2016-24 TaxID=2780090 RepID=UPI00187E0541|nr:hypothetical protein [Pedobacter sp. MC2016-24]MBE9600009.1 hypothetical protein [Pedobacter sp. MC2016-24]